MAWHEAQTAMRTILAEPQFAGSEKLGSANTPRGRAAEAAVVWSPLRVPCGLGTLGGSHGSGIGCRDETGLPRTARRPASGQEHQRSAKARDAWREWRLGRAWNSGRSFLAGKSNKQPPLYDQLPVARGFLVDRRASAACVCLAKWGFSNKRKRPACSTCRSFQHDFRLSSESDAPRSGHIQKVRNG